jgi:hypothetical protein
MSIYPSLPLHGGNSYLNPSPLHHPSNIRAVSSSSPSDSSVDPITPPMPHQSINSHHTHHAINIRRDSDLSQVDELADDKSLGTGSLSSSISHLVPSVRSSSSFNNNIDSKSHLVVNDILCKWDACTFATSSPEDLYEHLCNAHVGRKSTNNLCLTCAWEGCGVKCVKRDHITSHLRGE